MESKPKKIPALVLAIIMGGILAGGGVIGRFQINPSLLFFPAGV